MHFMNSRKIISTLLLIAISFSTLHAFTISLLDDDHCNVSEYIQEIEQASSDTFSGDICDIHHEFHVLFLLPDIPNPVQNTQSVVTEISAAESYTFYLQNNVLQPPIKLS